MSANPGGGSDFIRDETIRDDLNGEIPAPILDDPVEFSRLCLAYRLGWEAASGTAA